MNYTTLCS